MLKKWQKVFSDISATVQITQEEIEEAFPIVEKLQSNASDQKMFRTQILNFVQNPPRSSNGGSNNPQFSTKES